MCNLLLAGCFCRVVGQYQTGGRCCSWVTRSDSLLSDSSVRRNCSSASSSSETVTNNEASFVAINVGYPWDAVSLLALGKENSQRILLVLLAAVDLPVGAEQSALAASWERAPLVSMAHQSVQQCTLRVTGIGSVAHECCVTGHKCPD
jgi:hypothetical protein